METIVIAGAKDYSLPSLAKKLTEHAKLDVEVAGEDSLVVHGNRSRVYVYLDDVGPTRLCLDYSDVELVKKVVVAIADDPEVMVDNDFGVVLPGDQFVKEITSRLEWDWRR